jgi:hypothetical protein
MVVPEIDIPGHASALLFIGVNKVAARCMLLDEDLEFMIRHSILRILKHINYLVKFLMKCVRCLPVTTFILAETKITVKSGMQILPFNNLRKKMK